MMGTAIQAKRSQGRIFPKIHPLSRAKTRGGASVTRAEEARPYQLAVTNTQLAQCATRPTESG